MVKASVVKGEPKGFPTGAIVVLLIGIIFLLDALDIISKNWSVIFPSLIIIIGVSMLYKHYRN